MQQRQLRLGDILDDYCPRERRLTNHAVVAMIGDEVKQTRCMTCDAEHEYKHARVPRPRRKIDAPALASPGVIAPKKVTHEAPVPAAAPTDNDANEPLAAAPSQPANTPALTLDDLFPDRGDEPIDAEPTAEEGPVHRQLIRAQLPRVDNQPAQARPAPDFTIRQPAGRPGRFRPRHHRGGPQGFQGNGNRVNGNMSGNVRGGGGPRPQGGGRPPMQTRGANRHGHGQGQGRKRSK